MVAVRRSALARAARAARPERMVGSFMCVCVRVLFCVSCLLHRFGNLVNRSYRGIINVVAGVGRLQGLSKVEV